MLASLPLDVRCLVAEQLLEWPKRNRYEDFYDVFSELQYDCAALSLVDRRWNEAAVAVATRYPVLTAANGADTCASVARDAENARVLVVETGVPEDAIDLEVIKPPDVLVVHLKSLPEGAVWPACGKLILATDHDGQADGGVHPDTRAAYLGLEDWTGEGAEACTLGAAALETLGVSFSNDMWLIDSPIRLSPPLVRLRITTIQVVELNWLLAHAAHEPSFRRLELRELLLDRNLDEAFVLNCPPSVEHLDVMIGRTHAQATIQVSWLDFLESFRSMVATLPEDSMLEELVVRHPEPFEQLQNYDAFQACRSAQQALTAACKARLAPRQLAICPFVCRPPCVSSGFLT